MDDLSSSRRPGGKLNLCAADGAGLSGPVAYCDRLVEDRIQKFLGGFGALAGDINADLAHSPHRAGVDCRWINPGAIGLISIAVHGPQEPLRHLGAGGVVSAQEQDFLFSCRTGSRV